MALPKRFSTLKFVFSESRASVSGNNVNLSRIPIELGLKIKTVNGNSGPRFASVNEDLSIGDDYSSVGVTFCHRPFHWS